MPKNNREHNILLILVAGLSVVVGILFTLAIITYLLAEIEKTHGDYPILDYTGVYFMIAFSALWTLAAISTFVSHIMGAKH